ncbi:hypothetical protein CONCODRAFT_12089 [Conidiobolus coronatus NRRL 28638]|uniref:G-protein coupled receptors family 1 profile domain-containing protein n=1 Tax=Conidiobolus coronatus (strain ATCC 28846 / CBS 209.66 / NRRL 28638) TaxID=796925 RepID=A0A137NTV5_CONC2|nr:hypothetical protein CONCODRAFT_12089 [Conidiobolus coronatus NRRL 28638]|eukprot:KXN66128.1 hypothetical protein CONCODRAFT_12089 [Conidiobolus coronatus NRRL 28638]
MIVTTSGELCWASYMVIACALKLYFGPDFISPESLSCQIYILFNTGNLRLSNGCVAILAIMRYMLGCRKKEVKNWVWYCLFIVHISVCIALSTVTFVRWDGRRTSSGIICLQFFRADDTSINLMIFHTFYILLLCGLVVTFYFLICKHWYIHLSKLKKSAIMNNEIESVKVFNIQQRKLIVQGSVVILSDSITFIPSTTTHVMKIFFGYHRPPVVDAFIVWSLTTLPIVNPIITLWLQPEVNAEFCSYYYTVSEKLRKLIRYIY